MGELAFATKCMTAGYSVSRGSTSLMINAYPIKTLCPLQQGLHMQPRSTVRTANAIACGTAPGFISFRLCCLPITNESYSECFEPAAPTAVARCTPRMHSVVHPIMINSPQGYCWLGLPIPCIGFALYI
ncbi:uncharacterized protein BDW70DRAFT_136415 [Aspergillus foveolatus]|uniref:uncharacterized protein n=1 Tax=Aspergillus foveolatus TaxID=210207 RepID=UPI003CCD49B6